jgi:uncharacterized protein YndB with AHSA1/START domain
MSGAVQVERTMAASPDAVWRMVADVTRVGEWSPETVACEWLGTPAEPVVGARFKGRNARGSRKWSTKCTMTDATPGEIFAFEVVAGPMKVARWEYRFAPDGDGCRVTETWIDRRGKAMVFAGKVVSGVADRAEHNRSTMEQTLTQLATAAEAKP